MDDMPQTRTISHATHGILSEANSAKREEIVGLLTKAYFMEMETVISYTTASANIDGIRGDVIAQDLRDDVQEELGHAQRFADRIRDLYGQVPGSQAIKPEQDTLQPPEDDTDVVAVIKGVIDAEAGAIAHYVTVIEACDGVDWATQDMVIDILRDEENHLRTYERYLREYEG
jgi:bacterioferritin